MPIGIRGAIIKYGLIEEFDNRLAIPFIDVEAVNNPAVDTRIPVAARNFCLRESIGLSSASMIKKKTTDENDTNEKTTKT